MQIGLSLWSSLGPVCWRWESAEGYSGMPADPAIGVHLPTLVGLQGGLNKLSFVKEYRCRCRLVITIFYENQSQIFEILKWNYNLAKMHQGKLTCLVKCFPKFFVIHHFQHFFHADLDSRLSGLPWIPGAILGTSVPKGPRGETGIKT